MCYDPNLVPLDSDIEEEEDKVQNQKLMAISDVSNFSKYKNMFKAFSETLFSVRRHLLTITRCSNSLSQ